jgi:Na+/proline symporter
MNSFLTHFVATLQQTQVIQLDVKAQFDELIALTALFGFLSIIVLGIVAWQQFTASKNQTFSKQKRRAHFLGMLFCLLLALALSIYMLNLLITKL